LLHSLVQMQAYFTICEVVKRKLQAQDIVSHLEGKLVAQRRDACSCRSSP
jgi:hypothetical protein